MAAPIATFTATATLLASDAGLAAAAVRALPGNFGRYASGKAAAPGAPLETAADISAAVAAALADANAALGAVQGAASALAALSAASDAPTVASAALALVAALLAAIGDPADQVRIMLALAQAVPGADAASTVMRRVVLVQMARACAAYQPSSYNDAVALRLTACAALDAEIIVAADAGNDQTYLVFRALRVAVTEDLQARGDPLPQLRTVQVPPLPAAVLAYRLYGDATRADEVVARVDPVNPLFMPPTITVLDK